MPPSNKDKERERGEDSDPFTSARIFPNKNDISDIDGFVQTIAETPATGTKALIAKPKNFEQQFILVKEGGSTSAFIYDAVNKEWNHVALTTI